MVFFNTNKSTANSSALIKAIQVKSKSVQNQSKNVRVTTSEQSLINKGGSTLTVYEKDPKTGKSKVIRHGVTRRDTGLPSIAPPTPQATAEFYASQKVDTSQGANINERILAKELAKPGSTQTISQGFMQPGSVQGANVALAQKALLKPVSQRTYQEQVAIIQAAQGSQAYQAEAQAKAESQYRLKQQLIQNQPSQQELSFLNQQYQPKQPIYDTKKSDYYSLPKPIKEKGYKAAKLSADKPVSSLRVEISKSPIDSILNTNFFNKEYITDIKTGKTFGEIESTGYYASAPGEVYKLQEGELISVEGKEKIQALENISKEQGAKLASSIVPISPINIGAKATPGLLSKLLSPKVLKVGKPKIVSRVTSEEMLFKETANKLGKSIEVGRIEITTTYKNIFGKVYNKTQAYDFISKGTSLTQQMPSILQGVPEGVGSGGKGLVERGLSIGYGTKGTGEIIIKPVKELGLIGKTVLNIKQKIGASTGLKVSSSQERFFADYGLSLSKKTSNFDLALEGISKSKFVISDKGIFTNLEEAPLIKTKEFEAGLFRDISKGKESTTLLVSGKETFGGKTLLEPGTSVKFVGRKFEFGFTPTGISTGKSTTLLNKNLLTTKKPFIALEGYSGKPRSFNNAFGLMDKEIKAPILSDKQLASMLQSSSKSFVTSTKSAVLGSIKKFNDVYGLQSFMKVGTVGRSYAISQADAVLESGLSVVSPKGVSKIGEVPSITNVVKDNKTVLNNFSDVDRLKVNSMPTIKVSESSLIKTIVVPKFSSGSKVSSGSKLGLGSKTILNNAISESSKISEATAIRNNVAETSSSKSIERLISKTKSLLDTKTVSKNIPRMVNTYRYVPSKIVTFVPKIPIVPIKFSKKDSLYSNFNKKSFNLKKAFKVVSRVRGKEKVLAVGVPKNIAIAIGKSFTGKTTARSFKIKEIGFTQKRDIGNQDLTQYRSPKVGGRVGREGFTFVEKSKFAIDTIGEIKGLKAGKLKKIVF